MAPRSASPGGAILRASRIFSIPPPMRAARTGTVASIGEHNSETATTAFPVHLSITTPQSSLNRGDWGLKRSLPLRATMRSSTPVIKLKAIDTYEHITEFGSAADHTISLRKWQEMDIPISTPKFKKSTTLRDIEGTGTSVFEDEIDTTARPDGHSLGKEDVRWKFNGPWLAGQSEGEFNTYVKKQVRKRKAEFHDYLRKACADVLTKEKRREAQELKYAAEALRAERARISEEALSAGEDSHSAEVVQTVESANETEVGPAEDVEIAEVVVHAKDVTEEQLTEYIKNLRKDRPELYQHVRTFLDLPPAVSLAMSNSGDLKDFMSQDEDNQVEDTTVSTSPYAQTGPPRTHPSAGLSYSRTASHIHNHPVWGPQKSKPPIEARVVMPRGAGMGFSQGALGVGGFVTEIPVEYFERIKTKGPQPKKGLTGFLHIEPEKVGGSKTHVVPKFATVDNDGRVVLRVVPAHDHAVAVKQGKANEIQPEPMMAPLSLSNIGKRVASRTILGPNTRESPNGFVGGYGLDKD